MAGLIEYLTHIERMWRYRWLDTCLHDKEFELCISLSTGRTMWAFCLMIRNTLIMHCKEFKKFWICGYAPLKAPVGICWTAWFILWLLGTNCDGKFLTCCNDMYLHDSRLICRWPLASYSAWHSPGRRLLGLC
jgi:hypothetical protein